MKKILLLPAAIVIFAGPALAQNSSTTQPNEPGMSGNPGMNNAQSDQRNQPDADRTQPGEPGSTLTGGRTNDSDTDANQDNSGTSDPMNRRNAMDSTAPGSAPPGSTMPETGDTRATMGSPRGTTVPPGSVPNGTMPNGSMPTGSVPPMPR